MKNFILLSLALLLLPSCSWEGGKDGISYNSTSSIPKLESKKFSAQELSKCISRNSENFILNTKRAKELTARFLSLFPNVKDFSGHIRGAEYQCDLGSTGKLVNFSYNMKEYDESIARLGRHTLVALLSSDDRVIGFSDTICPVLGDVGAAPIIGVADNYLLLDCSAVGTPGAISGEMDIIFDYHVVDLRDFSEKMVWRKTIIRQDTDNVLELVDNTSGLPENLVTIIKETKF